MSLSLIIASVLSAVVAIFGFLALLTITFDSTSYFYEVSTWNKIEVVVILLFFAFGGLAGTVNNFKGAVRRF